jgi:hypothetical protein
MSLKAFHVFFMLVSILMLAAFGVWGIQDWRASSNGAHLALGVVSLQGSVLLIWYFTWFLKKLKGFSYL